MRPSDTYATFNGVEFRVVSSGRNEDGQRYVGLLLDASQPSNGFDNVVERAALGDRVAIVPIAALDKYERVVTTGRYDGEDVWVNGSGPRVPCGFLGDPDWAARHGFTGSPHDGWVGAVESDQITNVEEHVTDLLASH